MATFNHKFFEEGLNTDSLEQRFIPIREESNVDYPNFDIGKTYPGEWKICDNFPGFNNVQNKVLRFLDTHNAKINLVNDYEIICKTNDCYVQVSMRNIDSNLYYTFTAELKAWLEQIKNK